MFLSFVNTKCEHLKQHDGDLSLPTKNLLLEISLKSVSLGNKSSNCTLKLELSQPSLPCFCSANGLHNCRIITICNENSFFSMSSGTTSSCCIDQSSSLHNHFSSGNHHSCGDATSHARVVASAISLVILGLHTGPSTPGSKTEFMHLQIFSCHLTCHPFVSHYPYQHHGNSRWKN